MFALTGVDTFAHIALKVEPEAGAELREQYTSVVPAYHMNKKHWINVLMDGAIPDKLVKQWIDNSYDLVLTVIIDVFCTAMKILIDRRPESCFKLSHRPSINTIL